MNFTPGGQVRFLLQSVVVILGGTVMLSAAASSLARRAQPEPGWIASAGERGSVWNSYRMSADGAHITRLTDLGANTTWTLFYPAIEWVSVWDDDREYSLDGVWGGRWRRA